MNFLYSRTGGIIFANSFIKSASFVLALLFIFSQTNPVFAQESETVSPQAGASPETIMSVENISSESVVSDPEMESVVTPDVTSDETEPAKEKGSKKLSEPGDEEIAPVDDPVLDVEAMMANAAVPEPEEQTLGKYLPPQVTASDGALTYEC